MVSDVQASRPHHNPLSNTLPFVGQASRLPGARAAFSSSVILSEAVSFLSFRPSEPSERAEESVGRVGGKSEIRNPKFKGHVGGIRSRSRSRLAPPIRFTHPNG